MKLSSHPYPFSYYKGLATTFTRSDRFESSYFGGPCDFYIDGIEFGPSHVHHIATISNNDLGIHNYDLGFKSPFIYGMCFDGCALSYKRTANSAIEITSIEPSQSTDGWPYNGYPPLLPYLQLRVEERQKMPLTEFSEAVMQGIDSLEEHELILIVPTNPLMEASLWGPSGDKEEVQIIYIYNTETGVIEAYNACS